MRLHRYFIFGIAFLFLLSGLDALAQTRSGKQNFDANWQFHKGDIALRLAVKAGTQGGLSDTDVKVVAGEEVEIAYSDKNKVADYKPTDWTNVHIPHDWSVEGPFINDPTLGSEPATSGFLPVGVGFYRKEFDIPSQDLGKKITIEFDGIFRNSTVWVNGHLMGSHPSGYTPSNYDLTDVLRYGSEGKNVILVKVDATDYEGWWYDGCGIYRHTWLVKTGKLHVARFGTYITTPSVSDKEAVVSIKTIIQNEDNVARNFKLVSIILNSERKVINTQSSSHSVLPLSQNEITHKGAVTDPLRWSPETPNLYSIQTQVLENDKVIDTYETIFGVRTIVLTTKGFFLNGQHYPIKGTANHQDFAGVGVALPDKLNEYKIKLLKEMGSNGYRSAHHPPTPELLDICDRMGMLVMDENRHLWSSENGLKDWSTIMLRDRNHPSVFMWSLENEEPLQGTVTGTRILQTLIDLTRQLDTTRTFTAAMNHGWNDGGYSDILDVVGYNYGQRNMQYVKDHEKYPKRKMIVSESTSYVSTRGEYEDSDKKNYMSNFGKGISWGLAPGQDWKHVVDYPYLSGTFVWTGFDYRGEPTPYRRWPSVLSHFGIMDLCGFPKDGYYAYKAAWTGTPIVHVFPHWNWPGKEGQQIKMRGYTNCEQIEILVNGKRIFKKKVEPYEYVELEAVYQPGKLETRGYKGGKLVIKEVIETTSVSTQLELKSDVTSLKADNCDVAIINIALKDEKGRVVPTADNLVKFSIEGPGRIIGTGNGNPTSHEPDKASQRKAFNGYCQVLVQSDKTKGEIRLKATSDQLKEAEVILKVE